jgi:hypothetical protein
MEPAEGQTNMPQLFGLLVGIAAFAGCVPASLHMLQRKTLGLPDSRSHFLSGRRNPRLGYLVRLVAWTRIAIFGFLIAAFASPAFAYCSAPSAPSCASRYGAFDDEDAFRRCKREMESYKSEAQDFLSCTKREADDLNRKSNNAIEEYNNAVESFNRRARAE